MVDDLDSILLTITQFHVISPGSWDEATFWNLERERSNSQKVRIARDGRETHGEAFGHTLRTVLNSLELVKETGGILDIQLVAYVYPQPAGGTRSKIVFSKLVLGHN